MWEASASPGASGSRGLAPALFGRRRRGDSLDVALFAEGLAPPRFAGTARDEPRSLLAPPLLTAVALPRSIPRTSDSSTRPPRSSRELASRGARQGRRHSFDVVLALEAMLGPGLAMTVRLSAQAGGLVRYC
jgi:hypothetical protein